MVAAGTGKLRVVDKLLELGADAVAADSNGNTARDYAATHRRQAVLERLKSHPGQCPLTGC
jgi:ankyrin repeat protein